MTSFLTVLVLGIVFLVYTLTHTFFESQTHIGIFPCAGTVLSIRDMKRRHCLCLSKSHNLLSKNNG